ncbi:deoxyuridine 5'-triphosphate nucleotidohydrolase [Aeromonas phage 65]|uniref:dUTP diphosphatase n=2 Tax=Ishigurovirus osborne TaxID=260149 RepID=A0A219YBM6_9CAUD|nr:deoxyuridine 5'-triphosphate nucleotidohydrolase [Aeromonas phage 65]AAR90929.1 deoxyuridine 5'-triphosphate nucleotidohydrolase [Aeromonas phage 65]APU01401.1 deoxyuridine 5'-triphosphate nucleotidohydrolase [Aeromonas phage 65.2]
MEMNFISGFEYDAMPDFQREGDAAIDLRTPEAIMLKPGEDIIVNTGMRFDMSQIETDIPGVGIAAMILPRSGLGFKFYTRLANTVGLIDGNYQGEIMVKVRNEHIVNEDDPMTFNKVLHIPKGERFCQMVFIPVFNKIKFNRVDDFETQTVRGSAGIGSSGTK